MNDESHSRPQALARTRNEGVTSAERYLKRLCDRTFLSLWSHAGVYRDQGKGSASADGKEVCDLLVVFENDVIIFSDKDCAYPSTGNAQLDWCRWFRKAVLGSAKQIWGAERWIRQFPDRLYLDRQCTQPFPIELPLPEKARVHRVIVAHEASARSQIALGGSGSLMIVPRIIGNEHFDETLGTVLPLAIGQLDPSKGFVHVFDDTSLDIVMAARNTISDFVDYLSKKKSLILSGKLVSAAGEEELLAYYLGHLNGSNQHDFVVAEDVTHLVFIEGEWANFLCSPEYKSQQHADGISGLWDGLIEKLTGHFLDGTTPFPASINYADQERILRYFARESRFRRRILAERLLEAIDKGKTADRFVRVCQPMQKGNPYFVFLTMKKPESRTYEEYVQTRRWLLESCCLAVKLEYPDALDIVGFATEPGVDEAFHSADASYLDARQWDQELEADARDRQARFGLLKNVRQYKQHYKEYPVDGPHPSRTNRRTTGPKGRVGRNSPCPCGSGKKFKNCCWG